MSAALRTFLMLALGPVAVLVGGLPPLLRTGQVDLQNWSWPSLLLIPAALFLSLRRGWPYALWAGVGSFGTVLIFDSLSSSSFAATADIGKFALVIALAVIAGLSLPRRWWVALIAFAAALTLCWVAHKAPVAATPPPRPKLAVISALPLFWKEGDAGFGVRSDAPIITLLRQRFDVLPVDSPLRREMVDAGVLLMAQPRAFSPAEFVTLDNWVRDGGRLLLLADPLLRWPSSLPLGDRRRPPVISMMGPLLKHWGLELLPPATAGEERHILDDGRAVRTMGRSAFATRPDTSCRLDEKGLVARCRIGRGHAVLVADADLIDDRLWLADAADPLNLRHWSADNGNYVVELLNSGPVEGRRWLRSTNGLLVALRWSLLVGIGWAIVGAVLLTLRFPAHSARGSPAHSAKTSNGRR